jgi:N-acetylneuraminic acid mutarotase
MGQGPSARRRRLVGIPLVAGMSLMAVGAAGATSVSSAATATAATATAGPRSPVNTWLPTGPMAVARSGHTATRLPDGSVLVAGAGTNRAERYDPALRTFTATGPMSVARQDATATLLADGDVLVAGGTDGSVQLSTAELYHPATATWTPTGAMHTARSGHTATLLPDGDVLVAGGGCNGHAYGCDSGSYLATLRSAELYDPGTGQWSATGKMHEGRQYFTSTLLPDGRVLVAGGFADCDDSFCSDLSTAELYDPTTGTWSTTGSFHGPREQQTASLLADGMVLVAGGFNEGGWSLRPSATDDAELYDPSTGRWTRTAPMPRPRYGHTATALANGWVLVAGGRTADAELYQPQNGTWVPTGNLSTARTHATATLLSDGEVLVTGGTGPDGSAQPTAERYVTGTGPLVGLDPGTIDLQAVQVGAVGDPATFVVTNAGTAPLTVVGVTVSGADPGDVITRSGCTAKVSPGGTCTVTVRFAPTATGLRTADVAVVDDAPLSPQAVAVSGYGAGPYAWAPTGPMAVARDKFTATPLVDGTVLVAGGEHGYGNFLSDAERYDPTSGTFTPTGSLGQARAFATATRLADGRVLVAGGIGTGPSALTGAELYDPASGRWSPTGAMLQSGSNLSSVLLADGDVLVEGYYDNVGAEVYDPTSGTWANTGPLPGGAAYSTLTLLHDGHALAAGGGATTAAVYDPVTDTWAPTGTMVTVQQDPTATPLADGQVLVVGGNSSTGVALATSELYDPSTRAWVATHAAMNTPRFGHTATLQVDGRVMVAGGCTASSCGHGQITATTEFYDPASGYWYPGPSMVQARFGASAVRMADGNVLVAGGSDYCCTTYDSAERFTPTLVTDDPHEGPAGQVVVVRGSGFYAHETVRITWDGGVRPIGSARTSDRGTLTTTVTVPTATPGAHLFTASGSTSYASAQVAFTVT